MDLEFVFILIGVILVVLLRLFMSIHEYKNQSENSDDYRKFLDSRPLIEGRSTRMWQYFTQVYLNQPSKEKSKKWHTLQELEAIVDAPPQPIEKTVKPKRTPKKRLFRHLKKNAKS